MGRKTVNMDREKNSELLDVWYGDHRFRSKSVSEYTLFLRNLLHELLVCIAHVCRDIREIEGRR